MSQSDNAAQAARVAATVLDAMDDGEVYQAYAEACNAVTHYGALLKRAGVPDAQIMSQMHSLVVEVICRAMGVD